VSFISGCISANTSTGDKSIRGDLPLQIPNPSDRGSGKDSQFAAGNVTLCRYRTDTQISTFTEALRGYVPTLGFHATSEAESANQMTMRARGSRIQDLTEIMEAYSRAYQVNALGVKWRPGRQFCSIHMLQTLIVSEAVHAVCDLIDIRTHEGTEWCVTQSMDNDDMFEATNGIEIRWRIAIDGARPKCECNEKNRLVHISSCSTLSSLAANSTRQTFLGK
jgi:hypothetical protein